MTWNYRIIKHLATDPENTSNEDYFGLYEVYYNEDGTIMSRTTDALIIGDTIDEIGETLDMMKRDIENRPLLIDSNIDYNSIDTSSIERDLDLL